MKKPNEQFLNGIELDPYKTHPRILELRIIMLHVILTRTYDFNTATELFKNLSGTFKCNWTLIQGILNRVFEIRKMEKIDVTRFRQEIVFMCLLYNESRYVAADRYLRISRATMYKKSNNLNPKSFVTQEWLDILDENVKICGVKPYHNESIRFLESLELFLEALGRVSVPKT